MGTGAGGRVLLVDDDDLLREATTRGLELEGFEVDVAVDGEAAIARFDPDVHAVVVVDLLMPKATGMSVLRAVRERASTPVVVVSGYGDDATRVVALEMGAADFVTKPVGVRELALRLRNATCRPTASSEEVLRFGSLEVWPGRREVCVDGQRVELTERELDLLVHLARSPGQVHTRAMLLQRVWSSNVGWQSPTTVTEHIYRLRRKLEPDPDAPRWIHTVRGAGYRFSA